MTHFDHIQLEHELDAAWIIALWKILHGGDPVQEIQVDKATVLTAAGLAEHLAAALGPAEKVLDMEQLQARLEPLGIQVERGESKEEMSRPYRFIRNGERISVDIPLTHVPH